MPTQVSRSTTDSCFGVMAAVVFNSVDYSTLPLSHFPAHVTVYNCHIAVISPNIYFLTAHFIAVCAINIL